MSTHSWLGRRVALALTLMVSFYLLALAVAGGLLWIAFLSPRVTHHRVPGRLMLFCVMGAGSVLWAIIPRRDKFEAPGPQLHAGEQPEVFGLIEDVAAATAQEMPAEVYLVNDVNAFVMQRGGIMGVGSRRVMGIGLPLMQALTVDEFKAVLAHEFGHFHSGDVALGPWIHKTRAAVGRTIQQLSENILRHIFIAYGTLFLRVTQAVSRRQEFIADEVAAGVTGGAALASGLRKVSATSVAYDNYWSTDLAPVLRAGFVPPVTEGFGRFMQQPHVTSLCEAVTHATETEQRTDVYDTHPSLGDRVAALAKMPHRPASDTRLATSLLRDIQQCERRLLASLSEDMKKLKPLAWTAVAAAVYQPLWQERLKHHGKLLRGFSTTRPPQSQDALLRIGRAIVPGDDGERDQARASIASQLVVGAFGVALTPFGWTADTLPGEEAVLRRGAMELRPWSELNAIVNGNTSPDAWQQRCLELAIPDVPLDEAQPALAGGVPR